MTWWTRLRAAWRMERLFWRTAWAGSPCDHRYVLPVNSYVEDGLPHCALCYVALPLDRIARDDPFHPDADREQH